MCQFEMIFDLKVVVHVGHCDLLFTWFTDFVLYKIQCMNINIQDYMSVNLKINIGLYNLHFMVQ